MVNYGSSAAINGENLPGEITSRLSPRSALEKQYGHPGSEDILVPVFIADAEPAAGKLLLPDIPFFWLDCAGPGPVGDF